MQPLACAELGCLLTLLMCWTGHSCPGPFQAACGRQDPVLDVLCGLPPPVRAHGWAAHGDPGEAGCRGGCPPDQLLPPPLHAQAGAVGCACRLSIWLALPCGPVVLLAVLLCEAGEGALCCFFTCTGVASVVHSTSLAALLTMLSLKSAQQGLAGADCWVEVMLTMQQHVVKYGQSQARPSHTVPI